MNKPIKIRLHVLSPIHIGCDDVYEPTSFVIDEQKKKLIEFDPMDFVKGLNDKDSAEFSKICSGDNLLAIMKFIKSESKSMNIKGKEVDIATELNEHYKKVLAMSSFDKKTVINQFTMTVINQFTMNKTAYNPQNNTPYIPGSSLKGSLRTAYLSKLAREKNITKWEGKSDGLESKLLDRFEGKEKMSTDPFRMVKVSDLLSVGEIKTKIVYAINKKKKKSDKESLADKGGVYQIFEAIQPDAIFEGTINIYNPENSSGIKLTITFDNLKSYLNKFYIPLLENEIKVMKDIDIQVPIINAINAKFKGQINKTAFLIRLGRHSGAEAVTIEGNRYIKIMQGRDKPLKYLDHATTLWLASDSPKPQNNNGLLPFGWAVLEVMDGF